MLARKLLKGASAPPVIKTGYGCGLYDAGGGFQLRKSANDIVTAISTPTSGLTGSNYVTAWHPSGRWFYVGASNSPFILVYERTNDTFTFKGSTLSAGGTVRGMSVSGDGLYIAYTLNVAPYFGVMRLLDGIPSLRLTVPSGVLTGDVNRTPTITPDGTHVFVPKTVAPFQAVFKRNGDAYTQIADPDVAFTNVPKHMSTEDTGQYFVSAHMLAASKRTMLFKRTGDAIRRIANFPDFLEAYVYAAAVSSGGKFVLLGCGQGAADGKRLRLYQNDGFDNFTFVGGEVATWTNQTIYGCAISADGDYVACIKDVQQGVVFLKVGSTGLEVLPGVNTTTVANPYDMSIWFPKTAA